MVQKLLTAQRDFSAGEVRSDLNRSEQEPAFMAGLRQCTNFRILDTKKLANRQGRRAMFLDGPRVDEVHMDAGADYFIVFRIGEIAVRDVAGNLLFQQSGMAWTTVAAVNLIVWDVYQFDVYIAAQNTRPWILSWDGVNGWTLNPFQEEVMPNGQKRTFFYRLSAQNVVAQPSASTGNITLTFSAAVAEPQMVGTYMTWAGRQVLITGYVSPTELNATVIESLPGSQGIQFTQTPNDPNPNIAFTVGDEVVGGTSGAKGIVVAMDSEGITVQILSGAVSQTPTGTGFDQATVFVMNEVVAGPGGGMTAFAVTSLGPPYGISVWDDELMNDWRGWPSSLTVDQNRLALMNFPALPNAIGYSAIGLPTDLYIPPVNVTASNAILELAPNKSQILYMVPGAEYAEFLFCDNGVYYVPVTVAQPLSATAGLTFNRISKDGSAQVQPRMVHETIVYMSAGNSTARAITATGAYQRPYEVRPLSMDHDHMINAPICIAAPGATDPLFPERYVYIVNGDGTALAIRATIQDGLIQGVTGWTRISGAGSVGWISALQAVVTFVSSYGLGNAPYLAERLDASLMLDAGITPNAVPAPLAPPAGYGPLWWMLGRQVFVMDGTRPLGTYDLDATGNLIPQNFGGENLASPSLYAGFSWTATAEVFAPGAPAGQDFGQRTARRRLARIAAHFIQSTGFLFAKLYSGEIRPDAPALGAIVNTYRVTAYNQGDDATQPPPLREGAERWRPGGRTFDPRAALIKDTPGALEILEIDLECTI